METIFEWLQSCDIKTFATFIYGLISANEELMQKKLAKQGINMSVISLAPDIQIEGLIKYLNGPSLPPEEDTIYE